MVPHEVGQIELWSGNKYFLYNSSGQVGNGSLRKGGALEGGKGEKKWTHIWEKGKHLISEKTGETDVQGWTCMRLAMLTVCKRS